MKDITQAKNYAESRTGKGDKWYQKINDLKTDVAALTMYIEAHQSFKSTIESGLSTLALSKAREIARTEIVAFCNTRIAGAQKIQKMKLRQISDLEYNGVEE